MSSGNIDVKYVADLARIDLTQEQAAEFQPQLERILGYIEKLEALDVEGIEPTAHPNRIHNVFREDLPRPSLDKQAVLENSPRHANGLIVVPRVLE